MRHIAINFLVAPIFFLLIFAQSSANPPIVDELPQRPIYMFFDESEYQREDAFGSVTLHLFVAILQQAGPILASSSLLANIFFEQDVFLGIPIINDKDLKDPEKKKRDRKILLNILKFNDDDWVIKRVNDSLSLLVPVTYLKQLKIDNNEAKKSKAVAVTDLELHLGLKVEHMETIKLKNITYAQKTSANYVPKTFYNEKSKKSDVFCLYSDYAKVKIAAPMWSIFIQGHGKIEESIVGMDIPYFQRVLNFLHRFIKTRVLLYISCFAAGINNELIFKDTQAALERTYNFPIITQGITDAVVFSFIGLDYSSGNVQFTTLLDFNAFTKMSAQDVIKYSELALSVFESPLEEKSFKGLWWGNLPQIKFPGVEWFSVLDSPKYIASIGKILARTREENRPLKLSTYFGSKNLQALLLYAHEIPFELIIDEPDFEAIISMLPGYGVHKLKKISSGQNQNIDTIISWFFQVARTGDEQSKLSMTKQFYIEQINKDITEVVLNSTANQKLAFYRQSNKVFMQQDDDLPRVITKDDDYFTTYSILLKSLKAYSPQGRYDFANKDEVWLLPINRDTVFKYIHASEQSGITIEDIITELISSMGKVVLWIDSLKALNTNDMLALPAQEVDKFVTLTDVIIDTRISKRHFDYYYTFENSFFKGQRPTQDYKKDFSWLTDMQLGYSKLTVQDIQQLQKKLTQQKLKSKEPSKTKKTFRSPKASKPSGSKPKQKEQPKHSKPDLVPVVDIIMKYEEFTVALKTLAKALNA